MAKTKTRAEASEKTTTSPTLQKQPETPEKQAGPNQFARMATSTLPPPNGTPPPARAADLMMAPDDGTGAVSRARMMRAMQGAVGNARLSRMLAPAVQTKLTVGAPDDVYEQEADQVADRVMRAPLPPDGEDKNSPSSCATYRPALQRQAEDEESTPEAAAPPTQPPELQRSPGYGLALRGQDERTETQEKRSEATEPSSIQRQIEDKAGEDTGSAQGPGYSPTVTPEVESYLQTSRGEDQPLPPSTQASMEGRFGQDFGGVRVHTGSQAADASHQLSAKAFTSGQDIYMGDGRYQPDTPQGQRLLAHELTHTIQQTSGRKLQTDRAELGPARLLRMPDPNVLQRNGERSQASAETDEGAAAIAQAIQEGDVGGAVSPLRNRTVDRLRSIRAQVSTLADVRLERWLVARMNRASSVRTGLRLLGTIGSALGPTGSLATALSPGGATSGTAEEGLRLLWPALPLIDRLEVYDEGYREIEQAQIDVIRSASTEQRAAARSEEDRLEAIFTSMDPEEEYQARVLIDPAPEARYDAAHRLLERAPGVFSDVEDPVFDAILDLPLEHRRRFFNQHLLELRRLLYGWQFRLVEMMARGSEVDALIARLRLATEGRIDDQAAVQAVVDRAAALLQERQQLRAALAAPSIPASERASLELRLTELEDLDRLLRFQRGEGGEPAEGSFMGLVASARDSSEAFGADAQRLAQFATDRRRYAFEAGKQRILLAAGDVEAMRAAIYSVHAPPVQVAADATPSSTASAQYAEDIRLRAELLRDPEVAAVVGQLTSFNESLVRGAAGGDLFDETLYRLGEAHRAARWGEFFQLTFRIARRGEWRRRYEATSGDPFGVYARVHGDEREIMLKILSEQRMPLADILRYTDDIDVLRAAFADIGEEERERLRLGWSLARERPAGPLSQEQERALGDYREFEEQVRSSQTTLGIFDPSGFEAVMGAALGSEPTARELASGEGRYRAAALMYERQEARLALGRGASEHFTETDETMVAAARAFAALWLRVRDQNTLSMVDYAALSALHQRFLTRAEEFTQASNVIGELAGMIAATVAGIVVVVATGGTATPAVIALAAASGAGARVVTREMFGEDYYNSLGSEAARDALLGAIDGALAVVSGRLAARGAELIGMGGRTLTSNASRIAGSVAEEATQPFARRVASSAVESALDGFLSGTITEAFGALTDERTWRRGIVDGLVRVGQAALVGGLVGLGTGGAVGAAMPAVTSQARRLWDAAISQSLENTLRRAGAGDALTAARRAARAGNVDEVNRLAAELEAHLAPQEVTALRRQLGDELRQALGHPPGTAMPSTEAQARLLAESGAIEVPTRPEHLEAEFEIVRRSQPQPSREPDYIDEVDLGNGHTWRRREDGTWCRFTGPKLCGTEIPNAPAMSPTAQNQARVAAAERKLQEIAESIRYERDLVQAYDALVDDIVARRRAGETFSFGALSKREQEVIEQVFTREDRATLEGLTLRDLQAAREPVRKRGKVIGPSRLRRDLYRIYEEQERAIAALRESRRPLYDKVRAASPTERLRDRILGRARGLDEVSDLQPPSGSLDVDHIVPLREIVDMPGYSNLDWTDQVEVANFEPNLKAVDRSANRSRHDLSWEDTSWSNRSEYQPDALRRIIEEERELRQKLQKEIDRRLGRQVPR